MYRADAETQTVARLSGGLLIRAGLACVLGGLEPPSLLIMDEPTNHLDINSIEAIEAGLRAYDGALLVVSHDEGVFGRHRDLAKSLSRRGGLIRLMSLDAPHEGAGSPRGKAKSL